MALTYVDNAVNTRRRLAITRRSLILVLTVALVTATGCGIVRRSLVSSGTDTMAHLLTSVQAQPDPELVRQGLPAFILQLDGLIEAYPENPELLRAAATSYVAYAQAFLADPKDEERAARLYDRAHHYGMRLLRRHKHLAATLRNSGDAFEIALRRPLCRRHRVARLDHCQTGFDRGTGRPATGPRPDGTNPRAR